MRLFSNSAGMVLSMGISFPAYYGNDPSWTDDEHVRCGGASMPVAVQEAFTGVLQRLLFSLQYHCACDHCIGDAERVRRCTSRINKAIMK